MRERERERERERKEAGFSNDLPPLLGRGRAKARRGEAGVEEGKKAPLERRYKRGLMQLLLRETWYIGI